MVTSDAALPRLSAGEIGMNLKNSAGRAGMIQKLLEYITDADVRSLIENGVREGRSIEYKRELPTNTDADKKEFLSDISAFANAAGGDIVYGIDAVDGVPVSAIGLSTFNEDQERLRLENSIRDGIEPRVPGLRLHTVPGFPNGPVLIVRVPQSWAGPHMVTYKGSSRFFSRGSAGKFPMDVSEIRSAFDASNEIPKRIKSWRDERLGKIMADSGPAPLDSNGILVAHLIPLSSFANPWKFAAEDLNGDGLFFPPLCESGYNRRLNMDGLLTFAQSNNARGHVTGYAQVFRSGIIEGVCARLINERDGARWIGSSWIETEVVRSVRSYLKSLNKLGVEPPFVFLLSALQVRGAYLSHMDAEPIDRDLLCFPDVVIDSTSCDVPQTLRPIFDAVWNACGFLRSFNYDDSGNWKPK